MKDKEKGRRVDLEIKYQVFISSTFTDLKEERQNITNVLLMADCIPAGMEAFVADDDEQFNIIKHVIDLCDYYILIIGERYGSVNPRTDKSYTEMEFDYAVAKGIPVLVFVKDIDVGSLDTKEDLIKKGKLEEFKKRALTGRMGGMWNTLGDLSGKVAISIMKARMQYNRPGWVRDLGFDPVDVSKQLNELQMQVIQLAKENSNLKSNHVVSNDDKLNLSQYKVKLHFTEHQLFFTSSTPPPNEVDIEIDLEKLFQFISVRLSGRKTDREFVEEVSAYKSGYYVDTQQALIVKSQFLALGLVEEVSDKKEVYITLSDLGKKEMLRLNSPTSLSQEY